MVRGELLFSLLIIIYLGLYFLGLYFSSKPKIPFLISVGLIALSIGLIIFTLTGKNIFISLIVAISHILLGGIIRKTSK